MERSPSPTRRSVLGAAALALTTGCLGNPPAATGPRRPPDAPEGNPRATPERPDLYVASFDFEATDAGNLRVVGTVGNRGSAEQETNVRVVVRVGGEKYVRETAVTVPPDGEAEFAVEFSVSESAFVDGGELDVTLA
jgi:hypothetical protein